MKAIILYPIFLVAGVFLAVATGLLVERHWSAGASVMVFIAMFFLSFYVAWLLTRFIVERTIRKTASGGRPERISSYGGRLSGRLLNKNPRQRAWGFRRLFVRLALVGIRPRSGATRLLASRGRIALERRPDIQVRVSAT